MHEKVEQVLALLRPALKADGGDAELDEVKQDGTAVVRLVGFCGCCHATTWTHRLRIERTLKEQLPGTQVTVLLGAAACATD